MIRKKLEKGCDAKFDERFKTFEPLRSLIIIFIPLL